MRDIRSGPRRSARFPPTTHPTGPSWLPGNSFAVGFAVTALLVVDSLGVRGLPPAVFLALAAAGSVQASFARTICFTNDGAWCTPLSRSAYPSAQWLHGIGTGVAFTSLLLACLAFVLVARGEPALRPPARAALAAVTIAGPMCFWFLATRPRRGTGSQKIFLLVLGAWTSYLSFYLGVRVVSIPPACCAARDQRLSRPDATPDADPRAAQGEGVAAPEQPVGAAPAHPSSARWLRPRGRCGPFRCRRRPACRRRTHDRR